MANFGIKIDCLKLNGAVLTDLQVQGQNGVKKCLVIPVEDNPSIFVGSKGCYLSMTAIELKEPKYNDSHCIKPDYPKAIREAMTEEQRRDIPIIGGLHAFGGQQNQQPQQQFVQPTTQQPPIAPQKNDDLPF